MWCPTFIAILNNIEVSMFANTTHCTVKKKIVYLRSALVAAAASPPSAAPPSIEAPTPAQRLLYLTNYFLSNFQLTRILRQHPCAGLLRDLPDFVQFLWTLKAFHTVRTFFGGFRCLWLMSLLQSFRWRKVFSNSKK